jgi:hypothetical protein
VTLYFAINLHFIPEVCRKSMQVIGKYVLKANKYPKRFKND